MSRSNQQHDLFNSNRERELERRGPLAARMRPRTLDEFVGQQDVVGPDTVLRRMIERDRLASLILWGPPGVGKTTLARLIASHTAAEYVQISAVASGVVELRKIVAQAADRLGMHRRRTLLFIDEIHRFNRAQQDAILPYVEDGTIILVGATTENPSFEVNAPLLSRSRVVVLQALSDDDIRAIVSSALNDERGLGSENIAITDDALELLVNLANGDARAALNTLEVASATIDPGEEISREIVSAAAQRRYSPYDKSGEAHYDAISALHKSMRDSDPDAALYWLARMLEGGDDPLYVARRVVRFASEDVGLADPRGLQLAMSAQQAVHFIGMPEGQLALAQAVVYLSLAPKSNALYRGYGAAREDVEHTRNEPVPLHLRNAPTRLLQDLGYSEGYQYAHDDPDAVTDQVNLPANLAGKTYYTPTNRGFERELQERIEHMKALLETRMRERSQD